MEALQPALQPLIRVSDSVPLPISVQSVIAIITLYIFYSFLTRERLFAGIPLIEPETLKWLPSIGWMKGGKAMLFRGVSTTRGAFQIMTGTGPKIFLPNSYAEELRSHPNLNFPRAFSGDFFVNYPGFEGHAQGLKNETFLQDVVRIKLTQSLGLVTSDLVDETLSSFHDLFGESRTWHAIPLKPTVLDIIARLSSRVFLGPELAHNPRWLEIAKDYTVDSFAASFELRMTPAIIRPFVHWFYPRCRRLRANVRDATALITPEITKRVAKVEAAKKAGTKPPKVSDAIGWMHEIATTQSMDANYVHGQLSLSLAAIHTTTEGLTQALLDLAEHPEVVPRLREEVISVLSEEGWAKTSLYKLKLMDSFFKESQRVHVLAWNSMNRYVMQTTTLKDGTVLPAGARISVVGSSYRDSSLYPSPDEFIPDRFLTKRAEPGQENNHQFVSATPEYLVFGLGKHACPGRFFAVNELKIALAVFLLRYDVRFVEGEGRGEEMKFETAEMANLTQRLEIRRREEEIDLVPKQVEA